MLKWESNSSVCIILVETNQTHSTDFSRSAKLKNNREVCINPETKWLQQYLKNAINK